MALALLVQGDAQITGGLSAASMTLATGSVTNATVASGAAIDTAKLMHRYKGCVKQATAAALTEVVTRVNGATGTIRSFNCGSVVKCTSGSVTIDLKKNGTTCLSSTVVLDSGNTNYISEAGSLSVTSLVVGDVLTVVVTISSPLTPTGLFYEVEWDEAAV